MPQDLSKLDLALEQAHLPEGLLRCSVLEPLRICRWSSSGLETYLGKDLQFALVSLLSLSQQQRRLNQELARRWEAQSSRWGRPRTLCTAAVQPSAAPGMRS